jgi:hypothetical protein
VKVLELGAELGLVKVGVVSIDGTKVKANASKNRNVTNAKGEEKAEKSSLPVISRGLGNRKA